MVTSCPSFVQGMMALTSQVAESEERKRKKKKLKGKRAANDHVQGQRINKKRHQNVHKVRAAHMEGPGWAKASKVRSCGSSGNQRWRWRLSRSGSERRGLWSLWSARSLSLGSESRSRGRAGGGALPLAIWAGAAVVGVVADCSAGFW